MIASDYLGECQNWINTELSRTIERCGSVSHRLREAMAYATLGGGKRLRAALVRCCCETAGGTPAQAVAAACSVELVHAYSLVHDDLPAMDDDALRRGQPSCHCAFDEATAILAGDALLSLAFERLSTTEQPADSATLCAQIAVLARACGSAGMVGGQMLDMEATGAALDPKSMEAVHLHKTGDLIRAACQLGALAAAAPAQQVTALAEYGSCVGLAFQIQDDILDARGETATLGKQCGADSSKGKSTYVSLLGLQGAAAQAGTLCERACSQLDSLPGNTEPLRVIAHYSVARSS